jgi:hypothetical protein
MSCKVFRTIVLIPFFLLLLALTGFAGNERTTPYGDYCKDCGTYGTCKDVLSPQKAKSSLKDYYKAKGYRVRNIYHKERFIKADIYKNKKKVDKVLFDRKTGRLRSIY